MSCFPKKCCLPEKGIAMHSLRKFLWPSVRPLRAVPRRTRILLIASLAVLLPSCGTWQKASDLGHNVSGGEPGSSSGGEVTLARIQQEIFSPMCASCHTAGGPGVGLLTDAATSYATLVNVDPVNSTARNAGKKRVTPGDPTRSYLLQKLSGEMQFGEGDRMPQGGQPLTTAQIELIRRWIEAGAPPSSESGGGTPGAPGTISTLAGQNYPGYNGDGKPLSETQLYWPQDVLIDPAGAIYVVDWNNHRIRRANGPAAPVATVFGESKLGYDPVNHPASLSLDPQGRVLVAAWHNFSVYRLHPGQAPELVAGNRTQGFSGDGGPANQAQCDFPSSMAYDSAGNLYVSDQGNRRIRKVDPNGIISTFAGRGDSRIAGFAGDGGPATEALFDCVRGSDAIPCFKLDVDTVQNKLYICDTGNHRVRVIDLASGIITTFAGNGVAAFAGDGGPAVAASLNFPSDVAVAPDHSVYIADAYNQVVRRVDPQGRISTVAGTPGQAGFGGDNGAASSARLNLPEGVHVDRAGNLYIADVLNNRIRMVRPQ
jgi:sugar lactone lactonase YvrE/mono/diheme cytochrome c family protein